MSEKFQEESKEIERLTRELAEITRARNLRCKDCPDKMAANEIVRLRGLIAAMVDMIDFAVAAGVNGSISPTCETVRNAREAAKGEK